MAENDLFKVDEENRKLKRENKMRIMPESIGIPLPNRREVGTALRFL